MRTHLYVHVKLLFVSFCVFAYVHDAVLEQSSVEAVWKSIGWVMEEAIVRELHINHQQLGAETILTCACFTSFVPFSLALAPHTSTHQANFGQCS